MVLNARLKQNKIYHRFRHFSPLLLTVSINKSTETKLVASRATNLRQKQTQLLLNQDYVTSLWHFSPTPATSPHYFRTRTHKSRGTNTVAIIQPTTTNPFTTATESQKNPHYPPDANTLWLASCFPLSLRLLLASSRSGQQLEGGV